VDTIDEIRKPSGNPLSTRLQQIHSLFGRFQLTAVINMSWLPVEEGFRTVAGKMPLETRKTRGVNHRKNQGSVPKIRY